MAKNDDYVDLLNGISQMIDTKITPYVAGDVSSKKSYKYNKNLMAIQWDYNKQAFEMENAYNTPLNQRIRNTEAGINPNWTDSSGVSADMSSNVNPSSPNDGADMINAFSNLASTRSQMKLNKAQEMNLESQLKVHESEEYKNNQEGFKSTAEANYYNTKAQEQEIINSNLQRQYNDEHLQIQQNIEQSRSYKALLDAQKDYQEAIKDPTIKEIQARIDELYAEQKFEEAQTETENLLRYAKQKNLSAQTQEYLANAYKAKADVNIAWYNAKTGRIQVEGEIAHNLCMYQLAEKQFEVEKLLKTSLANLYDEQGKKVSGDRLIQRFMYDLVNEGYRNGFFLVAHKTYTTLLGQANATLERMKIENKMLYYEESTQVLHDLLNTYSQFVSTNSQALQSIGIGSMAIPNMSPKGQAPTVNILPQSQNYLP